MNVSFESLFSRVALLIFFALFSISAATAQTPPLAIPNLQFGNASGSVSAIAPLSDGGVLIGGSFDKVNGLPRTGVARLGADGSFNPAWNANLDFAFVTSLLVAGDYAYIGGGFNSAGGQPRAGLARVSLADGSVSMSWQADVGGVVSALATDGTDLFVGGSFGTVAGQTRKSVARLALDTGTLRTWSGDATQGGGFQGDVKALVVDGGYLYIAGDFELVAGQPRIGLARLQLSGAGAADPGWIANVSGGGAQALAIFGPHLYVGGYFDQLGSVPCTKLARVSTSAGAAVDAAWIPNAGIITALLVDSSGVLAASNGGTPERNGFAEFDAVTGATTSWDPIGTDHYFTHALASVNGAFLLGVSFGDRVSSVMRLVRSQPVDLAYRVFAGDSYGSIYGIAHAPDGTTYIGGAFQGVQGVAVANLARIDALGTLDSGWRPQPNGTINAINLAGGDLIAGGNFNKVGDQARRHLVKIGTGATAQVDGTWAPEPDGEVVRIAMDGGSVFAAGYFDNLGGVARKYIAKLPVAGTGTPDAAWNAGWTDTVHVRALAAANGALFVASSGLDEYLIKLSATSGARDMAWQGSANSSVRDLVAVGNELYAAGQFTRIGGVFQRRIAKLDQTSGAVDATWMPQLNQSLNTVGYHNGVVIAGPVEDVNGRTPGGELVALSGATGLPDFAWQPGPRGYPGKVAAKSSGIWIGYVGGSSFDYADLAAYSAPSCVAQPDNTPCNGGPGVTGATCQASVCRPALAVTSVTVSASPNPVVNGNAMVLSATVASAGAPASGLVRFYAPDGFEMSSASIVDGSGSAEVTVSADYTGVVAVYEGSPQHMPSRSAPISVTVLSAVARSDVNGDGRSDAVWYHTGVGGLIAMNANGLSLGPLYILDHEPDLNWKVAGIGDLNGDGRSDVIWRNSATGAVYAVLLDGATVVGEGQIYVEPNLAWRIAAVADFNGDNRADLLWRNESSGQVFLMLMNGMSVLSGGANVVYSEPNLDWQIAASGDLDGNGAADLIWRNQSTGDVFAMIMPAAYGSVVYSEPNLSWKIVGLADFNGDGRADILWQNTATGDVFQMQMDGDNVTGGQVIYNEPNTSWKIVALGDYNGDGRADILWQNSANGQVYMMLMNGFTISSGAFVYTEPDTQWKIVGP